jgi:hypothetical protein
MSRCCCRQRVVYGVNAMRGVPRYIHYAAVVYVSVYAALLPARYAVRCYIRYSSCCCDTARRLYNPKIYGSLLARRAAIQCVCCQKA